MNSNGLFLEKRRFSKNNPLIVSRWPLFIARAVTLAGFVLTILAGLFGSGVGSHNFAIIFVWIAWWTLLKLVFIPLGGRSWCAVCPVPMPGEWLAQGGIFPGGKRTGLGLRWPRKIGPLRLDGAWLQAGGFLIVGLFSAATLTTPVITGWVLLGILILATGLALVFEGRDRAQLGQPRRVFCNHLCPIGGFTGLYAQAAPLEVRVLDRAVCAAHTEKTCYEECPWGVYVAALQDNSPCGMCFECVRVCPNENVSVNLRAFGKDYCHLQTPAPPGRSLPGAGDARLRAGLLGGIPRAVGLAALGGLFPGLSRVAAVRRGLPGLRRAAGAGPVRAGGLGRPGGPPRNYGSARNYCSANYCSAS